MFVAVSWFVDGGVFPEKVNGGGAACERKTLSPLLMVDGFTASYRHLAMVAFDLLVTRWREARCRRRTSAGRRASCSMERPLTSAGGVLVDDERRLDDERLVFSIVGSEYVAEKQTVVTKSAGGVACSVNLQLRKSKVCYCGVAPKYVSTFQWGLLVYSCLLHMECLSVNLYLLIVNI